MADDSTILTPCWRRAGGLVAPTGRTGGRVLAPRSGPVPDLPEVADEAGADLPADHRPRPHPEAVRLLVHTSLPALAPARPAPDTVRGLIGRASAEPSPALRAS